MSKRYDQLRDLILGCAPRTIVEVGVHTAVRGRDMCAAARQRSKRVRYIGYDVFEGESAEFHRAALNGKGIPSRTAAEQRMKSIARSAGGVEWEFVVGNTAQTLHGRRVACDFAFIDGDHRVAMIRGDARALDCPLMVFDDYYVAGPSGFIVDTALYGANAVVAEFEAEGQRVELLPKRDLTKEGCFAVLAVVRRHD